MSSMTVIDSATLAPRPVASAEPFLRLEAIHKQFGPYPVLHDVCFEMAQGEVVAIIGPSGSGKSTLLRCINQLEPATRGRVSMGGVHIEAGRPLPRSELLKLRRRIGMVFQSFNLFPHLTVLRNVSLAQIRTLGRSAEEADARSLQLLDRVGLADKANAYPARCSGGQQQRIAIARALALEPELMLFDEPTSALDPELGLEVLAVMKELAREGMSMLVVTHEMHFAETVSDRVVVMAEGRIIEQGPSAEVMRKPQHARVAQFLQAVRNR
ncbi:amino acid ABC transporter ATP-binding protein [Pseudomonas sp. TKO26]|uniref:Amino acid ABC transporter ATP-binding protein, PAAT family n=1 Tax=Pseudomonas saponiphila TaxID=556534 RepID=A0A1H4P2F3_9PSED|nr:MULTISPECIES: amino acid ABC transporter ATP-binding protein [Pseudomonas]PYY82798.1 amino acid ABC transporter ATP-binding protein [Pseudomonas sp. TKO30]PYY84211.1 amino acid ABC transporter ATP-binding protein [Pseudomonas sp. TKO29]PYY86562.1 amino acid ABC transporter ATP-binding protein [Pseudomonas sp. TKO26]PYY98141.1 amino acid ABC transporter ATP-binding protein [Pseudomonas sp. TKO14]SEC01641.1 amino acid ABC transporter ATP-binding protein, PAAT family [Pseudomonas saponiphila]